MRRVFAAALVISLAAAGAALADETIRTVTRDRYASAVTTIDQGEKVTLQNVDVSGHDVTASQRGRDGKPLFGSELVGPGQTGPVEGTEYLSKGSYPFVCTVHPGMEAKLEVTSAGTPVPRPADRTKPKLTLKVASKGIERVAGRGELELRVGLDEAGVVKLSASAKLGGEKVALGHGTAKFALPSKRKVVLELSKSARRKLAAAESAAVTVRASARDTAGNTAKSTARRTLR